MEKTPDSQKTLAEKFGYGAGAIPDNVYVIDLAPGPDSRKKLSNLMGPDYGIRFVDDYAAVQIKTPGLLETLASQEFVKQITLAELALDR